MKKLFSIFLLLLVAVVGYSQNNFDPEALLKQKPAVQKLVNDYTGILTPGQIQSLENKLVIFNDSTSTQIAVIIIPTLNGNDVADYNVKLGRAWGVGGAAHNNGVVLLIAKDDRKLNIATGYGVEGALPDITCNQIINDVITPKFKTGDYYDGIEDGTNAIMQAVKGEYKAAPAKNNISGRLLGRIIFIIFMIILFLALGNSGRGKGGSVIGRGGFSAFMIGSMLGGSGGSSGGGGFGGGGFGGFGGGSFGGGGSSGSW